MVATSFFLAGLAYVSFALAAPVAEKRDDAVAFYDPVAGGGSWLNSVPNSGGGGEPLNVIISGLSSPGVLTIDGVVNYARSIGFSTECFGVHLGDPQTANLGDGNGWVKESILLREDYGDADFGTCLESLIGGNHFRVYRQNGPNGNSGALFLAASEEEDVKHGHTISPDGYNLGRDAIAAAANGRTSFKGVNYETTVERRANAMPAGTNGVNHGIAVDGTVVILTVRIV
ncbi:hypothetical protein BXZ70DRAFT_576971 [Cristinia sonorae]|uniref:Secreted protein n=1 Tax=Cristinia sonorae TaxID=1940300 RepID=A0A8K0UHG3_9AGAR|nr:hypothetical protein BXZ70DRAFT_576971 [Cristinia sonorae]